ncbi:MAG: laminin B domain-containing protein, partial [Saprospiraceae bacterium]
TGNASWTANGDPLSQTPAWFAAGGNPGGYIRVTDASTGGTWYFVAPAAFAGQKCDAYGNYLRYDELTSDTTSQQQYGGKPDVLLFGGGLQLIFDNAQNPGLSWTHYDILLREDAGWRINSLNGPIPTQAQFQAVLSDVAGLQIRGEYRAQADQGGLDNVVLESSFRFDLDGDDSSGAYNGNFKADTSCSAYGLLADLDAVLESDTHIDSVVVRVLFPSATDELQMDVLLGNVLVERPSVSQVVFRNDGTTLAADFLLSLHLLVYHDQSPIPSRGTRLIEVRVYTGCGLAGVATAFLPIYPPPDAGRDTSVLLCANGSKTDLFPMLGPAAEPGGYWQPSLSGGSSVFDPVRDAAGTYRYLFPAVSDCPGDTASITVTIEPGFHLPGDTTICADKSLELTAPANLLSWQWSVGSKQRSITVTSPGTYSLTGQSAYCSFSDSVTVAFYNCRPCPFYAPNVFSPNNDGENDAWSVQLPCIAQSFQLRIYDRWGSLVFEASDPQTAWDGSLRGQAVPAGVYLWQLEWAGDLLGKSQAFRERGDVTVVR